MNRNRPTHLWLPVVLLGTVFAWENASATPPSTPDAYARCATRLSISIKGVSPTAGEISSTAPQANAGGMLLTPEFNERFARFLNTELNSSPGSTQLEDAPYFVAKHVLDKGLPYSDLFRGQFDVVEAGGGVTVQASANGLGYFRTKSWLERYAGNETQGYRLVTAYRLMQNVVGLQLDAIQDTAGVDNSFAGRTSNPACKICHGDAANGLGPRWFQLDRVAGIFPRVVRSGNSIAFTGPKPNPAGIDVGGTTVTDDASLVNALVASENFSFNACRVAFKYLYGRPESTCEAPVFEKCRAAFKASGKIQDGLRAIAEDPDFCQ